MMQPSNTPPDGDFVRYVERLTAGKPAPGAQAPLFAPKGSVPAEASFAPGSARPLSNKPFLTQVKSVIGLWATVQALARRAAEEAQKFQPRK
jgi:hypothetical protein